MQVTATTGPSEFNSVKFPNRWGPGSNRCLPVDRQNWKGTPRAGNRFQFYAELPHDLLEQRVELCSLYRFCSTGAWENAETMLSGP